MHYTYLWFEGTARRLILKGPHHDRAGSTHFILNQTGYVLILTGSLTLHCSVLARH